MTFVYHIFNSPALLLSLRQELSELPQPPTFKDIESIPLLASTYAETLRLGVQIHIPRSAPYHDLNIGGVNVPRNKLIVVNTWLAHTDQQVWSGKRGEKPLDQFWAERFLVDSDDAVACCSQRTQTTDAPIMDGQARAKNGPRFSLEGLEEAWIPFGGMCLLVWNRTKCSIQ